MKNGGGKRKGSQFERTICVALSLWVTGGKRKDIFWRSAMSGGRATLMQRKEEYSHVAGDICAVAAEGHVLTDAWFIEAKHYKRLELARLLLGKGTLADFWRKARVDAEKHGNRTPVVIARQNMFPTLMLIPLEAAWLNAPSCSRVWIDGYAVNIYLFDELMKARFPFRRQLTRK